jgi:hypothetical protein
MLLTMGKAEGFIEPKGSTCVGDRWVQGMGLRGEYRFSSLMKGEKKGIFTLSFTSPEKDFFFIFIM